MREFLEVTSGSITVAGYKPNLQNQQSFLFTGNEHGEEEVMQNRTLRNSLNNI